jgi:hypothetical protein
MEYFYHYTKLANWESIQREGLKPGRPIGRGSRGWKSKHALSHVPLTFGLPSPAPEFLSSYIVNRPSAAQPHSLLAYLLKSISTETTPDGEVPADIVLMKVKILPSDDIRFGDYKHIAENYDDPSKAASGVTKYCQLVTNLHDNFNAMASMELPEVLCFNTIPPDRIEFVEKLSLKTYEDVHAYIAAKKKKTGSNSPGIVNRSPNP